MVDRLIELGYEHSPHLSRSHSYSIQGSEVKIRDVKQTLQISYFDDEIDDLLVRDESDAALISRLHEVTIYHRDGEVLEEHSSTIQNIGGDSLWTFDLDFFQHREELRAQFSRWIGFESTGTSLGISPIAFENLEEFGKYV